MVMERKKMLTSMDITGYDWKAPVGRARQQMKLPEKNKASFLFWLDLVWNENDDTGKCQEKNRVKCSVGYFSSIPIKSQNISREMCPCFGLPIQITTKKRQFKTGKLRKISFCNWLIFQPKTSKLMPWCCVFLSSLFK